MTIALVIIATLLPWLLGFAMVKPLIKRRYGYRFFAWGLGFPIGWLMTVLLVRVYNYLSRPVDVIELLVIELIVAVPLLFLSAKPCAIEELNFEKASANISYVILSLLSIGFLYHWVLIGVELLDKNIPDFAVATLDNADFATFVKYFMAQTWGTHPWVMLPWLGVHIASTLVVFGGLRYLGTRLLPSALTAYALVSLPMWETSMVNGLEAVWIGLALLSLALLMINAIIYSEWRFVFIISAFVAIMWLSNPFALFFTVGFIVLVSWYYSSASVAMVLALLLATIAYMSGWLHMGLSAWFPDIATVPAPSLTLVDLLWQQGFIMDKWHYLFIICAQSLICLMIFTTNLSARRFGLLLVASLLYVFVALFILASIPMARLEVLTAYFTHLHLYFVPALIFIPVSIYQLTLSEDTIFPNMQ